MPEHLRALFVILGLATVVFACAKGPACASAMAAGDFERRRNLWFAITLIAFLAHNFWAYVIAAGALLLFIVPREPNKLALYFFLLFAVPAIADQIPGLGMINQLFTIHYYRLLALTVLLPAFLFLRNQRDTERFGRTLPDKLFAAYLILQLLLIMQSNTVTNGLRYGVFYAFTDAFLPYYVASRSLKNLQDFRDALMAFVLAAIVLSAIGAFEAAKGWLLYSSLEDALGVPWPMGDYLNRDGTLRALASVGHSLGLGYVIAVALGFFLYLRSSVPSPVAWGIGATSLIVGLLSTLSRGPAMGGLAVVLAFLATSPSIARNFARLGFLSLVGFSVLMATPASDTVIDYLGVLGSIDTYNITYRVKLLMISLDVIMQNPLFGAYDFYVIPEVQELKQGQGIIDVVNTYVGIGLASGLVGLSLFAGFFVAAANAVRNALKHQSGQNGELILLGRALLATLLGVLVMIFTVSNIIIVPLIYWSVAGVCVAYARMLALAGVPPKVAEPQVPSKFQPTAMINR
jgi:hypothetical protein